MAELTSSPEKAGGRSVRNRTAARVDLTAMVDLTFLLITFFMLTTTLQKNNAMAVAMPDKTDVINESVPASRTLTVCLGSHNKALLYKGTADAPLTKPQIVGYDKNGLRKFIIEQHNQIKAATGQI